MPTTKSQAVSDNMAIWDAVCTTDPAMTKRVEQRGGFTAICAQYQIMTATKIWGSYGHRWGVHNLDWSIVTDAKGEPIELALTAVFFYPTLDGTQATFPISSDIKYRVGDDCRKKCLTDLTTKALSKLGFNADVFLGRFDDNKYVEEQRRASGQPQPPAAKPTGTTYSCPKCGKALALRKRKSDGNPFYSCTGWKADKSGCDYAADVDVVEGAARAQQAEPPQGPDPEAAELRDQFLAMWNAALEERGIEQTPEQAEAAHFALAREIMAETPATKPRSAVLYRTMLEALVADQVDLETGKISIQF